MSGTVVPQAVQVLCRLVVGPDYPPAPATGPPGRWRVVGRWLAFVLFLILSAVAAFDLQTADHLLAPFGLILGFVSVAPAAFAFHRPLWAWRATFVLLFLSGTWYPYSEPWSPLQILVLLFVLAVLAGRADLPVSAAAGAVTALPILALAGPDDNLLIITLVTVVIAVADQVRRRRASQHALANQTVVTQQEIERRAVLEERARIAREMHDVVAHHMSMIAVQAETAPYRLTGMSGPTRDEFTAIAGAARSALTDMRRLLAVLRSETEQAQRSPQPGLADVAELVEATRRAGLDVKLVSDPRLDQIVLAAPVGLAAYRIVQEALANTGRHAPGARVRVELRVTPARLVVRVSNGPARLATGVQPSTGGHGVIGMRERAGLLGGSFAAGPDDRSGFVVTAWLPHRVSELSGDPPSQLDQPAG
ncbi:sensor histidine kinase [Micromonospora sp. NBC_01813]|uniref:sensor histidine kinase n=1 Tax=Micromonospora sp. NBC_01813 TaxID=2975988 RepID=UPI002DD7E910|nr:histidine kinase [Micromonospora sp. NBC_01813]WSA09930.1 histidine kinase [Micromonospora sp. NBC_01813]